MKAWLSALIVATVLYSSDVQAGIAGKSYIISGITANAEFVDDLYHFGTDGSFTTLNAQGTFQEVDLGVVSFWFGSVNDTQTPEFRIDLVGLQLSTFLVSRGIDSDQLVYFLFGHELPETPETTGLRSP